MTNQPHPITPPDELRRLWAQQAQRIDPRDPVAWMQHVSAQAAQWGADQELKACCEVVNRWVGPWHPGIKLPDRLRAARRPKPPSLKEQKLAELKAILTERNGEDEWFVASVRQLLEALPND